MDASVSSFATMEMTNGNAKMNTVKGFIILMSMMMMMMMMMVMMMMMIWRLLYYMLLFPTC